MEERAGAAIVVHAGAWAIPAALQQAHLEGCRAAAEVGWAVLAAGGRAEEAVTDAIAVMEQLPDLNAGIGAVLTRGGQVELDAGLMAGRDLGAGAVAGTRRLAAPIRVARALLDDPHHLLLVAEGAERYARDRGFSLVPNEGLVVPRERELFERFERGELTLESQFTGHDTVGAIARDRAGDLAAGNSTGGVAYSLPGRVGDAALPGLGYYADNQVGAVACTGWGEQIVQSALAMRAITALEGGATPTAAAGSAVGFLRRRLGGHAGLILMDRDGLIGLAHSTPYLAHAYRTDRGGGVSAALVAPGGPLD